MPKAFYRSGPVTIMAGAATLLSLAFVAADYAEKLAKTKLDQLLYLLAMNAAKLLLAFV
jgi:hypothetical protein